MTKNSAPREFRWVTVDLHVHSIYSGGCLTPRGILEAAQRRFLDAVALTDHAAADSLQGALEAREISRGEDALPVSLVGREISGGDHFHFLLLQDGESAAAAPAEFDRRRLGERLACHHQQGGVIILAHPWTIRRNAWAKDCVADLLQANLLDGVELFNAAILGLGTAMGWIDPFLQKIWEEWIVPYHLGVTGGSDFHRYGNREIGTGRTYLKVRRCDEMGLLEALKARRCVAGLISDAAIPFSWARGETKILWGEEPWLGELEQMIATIKQYVSEFAADAYFGMGPPDDAGTFLRCLLAGGHYQMAYDLLRNGF